ncbi:hypothetical protein GGS24DRAFT_460756 [Hypoxylon argillaceum]|nr:hypothetical protein GGS24DRAFT_460756 [Hypoxylon argillaceum]
MSTGPGWAIRRNGSCLLTTEVDCGETMNPYRACCPSSTTVSNYRNQYLLVLETLIRAATLWTKAIPYTVLMFSPPINYA